MESPGGHSRPLRVRGGASRGAAVALGRAASDAGGSPHRRRFHERKDRRPEDGLAARGDAHAASSRGPGGGAVDAAVVVSLAAILLLTADGRRAGRGWTAPLAIALAAGTLDPSLGRCPRARGIPAALVSSAWPGSSWPFCLARGRAEADSVRTPDRAALLALLLRAAAVNNPDFYYRTAHPRPAGGEGPGEGPGVLRLAKGRHRRARGLRTEAYGRTYAFPTPRVSTSVRGPRPALRHRCSWR